MDKRGRGKPGSKRRYLTNLWSRFGGICQICYQPCSRKQASREHVVRRADGGPNTQDNIVLAHKKCNMDKGAYDNVMKHWFEWRASIDE